MHIALNQMKHKTFWHRMYLSLKFQLLHFHLPSIRKYINAKKTFIFRERISVFKHFKGFSFLKLFEITRITDEHPIEQDGLMPMY